MYGNHVVTPALFEGGSNFKKIPAIRLKIFMMVILKGRNLINLLQKDV